MSEVSGLAKSRMRARQEMFLHALVEELGIVSYACDRCGITRQTHYSWKERDPTYPPRLADAIRLAEAKQKALVQTALVRGVKKGDRVLNEFCRRHFGEEVLQAILRGDDLSFPD